MSVDVGYFRRWFGNFLVTDNLRRGGSGLRLRSASRRRSMRGCPTAAATRSPACTTSIRRCSGRSTTLVTAASNFGKQTEYWHGVDVNVNARLPSGLTVQGGHQHRANGDGQLRDQAKLPEIRAAEPVLPRREPFLTQSRVSGRTRFRRWTCR